MKISKQIKELTKHRYITTTELAEKLNTSQGNITNKLSRDNFRINELEEIANALEYTDIEIILRGSKEDAIIFEDRVEYKPHNIYMMLDGNTDLIKDVEEHGFRNKEFKDLVIEFMEEELKPIIGDLWHMKIPNGSEKLFKDIFLKAISQNINDKAEED